MKNDFVRNPGNTAVAYYRSGIKDYSSIQRQREAAYRYAAVHNMNIIAEYTDCGVSGNSLERPALQKLLHEIKDLKASCLIVYDVARLSRDRMNSILIKKILRDAGVRIVYTAMDIPEGDGPMQNLIEAFFEAMCEYYAKNLRENVTRGLRYNAEKAYYNGVKILGYKGEKHKRYEIDENTASVVRKIYDDYVKGMPLRKIVADLNSAGKRTANGKEFSINSLRHILKNRAYIGEYRWSDVVIPDGMPAIISEDIFEQVQDRMKSTASK